MLKARALTLMLALSSLALPSMALSCGGGGCGTPPEVAARVAAAEAWDRGQAALAAGDPAAAAEHFAAAEALDPDSPVLPAWRARALEKGGQEALALQVLDQALGRFPQDVDLRFNRAGLRARAGDLEGAAADLHLLVRSGAVQPEEAGQDPDLAALRGRPELAALVPAPAIDVLIQGETGSVLLGDSYDAVVVMEAPEGLPVVLRDMGEAPGMLRRERVVEDRLPTRPGRTLRRLELSWRTVAAGQGTAGPWLFTAGGSSGLSERLELDVVEAGRRKGPQGQPAGEGLVLPSELLAGRSPPWAGEVEGRLCLLGPPGAVAEVTGPGGPVEPEETWELREQSQPRAVARLYPASTRGRVLLREGRTALLEQDWPPPAP